MEVEKLDLPLQTGGKQVKLFQRQTAPLPSGLGTEDAVVIADIGYLEVTACYHLASSAVIRQMFTTVIIAFSILWMGRNS